MGQLILSTESKAARVSKIVASFRIPVVFDLGD